MSAPYPGFVALPRRVLLVDDDPAYLELAARAAEAAGCEADRCAKLGPAAVRLGLSRYALVCADWRLGGGESGLELQALVQRFQPQAAFAVMTAARDRLLAQEVDVRFPVLEKPFDRRAGARFITALVGR